LKLIVPYVGQLQPIDSRLLCLAEFLGIPCDILGLTKVSEHAEYLEKAVPTCRSCFVVNPQVMREWVGPEGFSSKLVAFLLSRFRQLLVHGVHLDPFDMKLVAALSRDKLQAVDAITGSYATYKVATDSRPICEAFSGLEFGPAHPINDHVFRANAPDPDIRPLISIGGRPFMAAVKLESSDLVFVASEDVVDLNATVGDAPLVNYFSRFVPHAMALRYFAGEACWRPCKGQASIIIDDPLLRKRYGFLDIESLPRLADQHRFHAVIAFIPHNFRRSSRPITRLFLENAGRLSICFHGNDHTESEFASKDLTVLSTLLQNAEHRMRVHEKISGLRCDRVMVFPQGNFSIEAMQVLRSRNFSAAVNTIPYPMGEDDRLTIRDVAQPAVLQYGGFPLFLRKPSRKIKKQDIAFNVFFGRPVLIVEHHEIFKSPEPLFEVVANINLLVPEVRWANLTTIASHSFLTRSEDDGRLRLRPYAELVSVSNDSSSSRNYLIQWQDSFQAASVESILENESRRTERETDYAELRVTTEMAPNSCRTFSLVHRDVFASSKSLGYERHVRAFVRRRLSEVRDNYLSKNQRLLRLAKTVQQHLSN
jgi:hypothetical protein